jgi:tetratricopeptide (TPR) repeat protein
MALDCFERRNVPGEHFDHRSYGQMAWFFAKCPEPMFRNTSQAVELALHAQELSPEYVFTWRHLGAALYRAGDWNSARAALEKSMELRQGGNSFDWFFLAMTLWQLDQRREAREWYDKADNWMNDHMPAHVELLAFRAEAKKLLGVE